MFENTALENELKYSHTIDNAQAVWVEWNLNQTDNIDKVGNYRYRPGTTDPNYSVIRSTYDAVDPVDELIGFKGYYTGATDADIIINAGFDDSNDPAFYIAPKRKINLLYSLDDCFKQNRPRSGINKMLYLGIPPTITNDGTRGQYIDSLNTFRQIKAATIVDAESSVNQITYTAAHNFIVGDYVKVTGVTPSQYNFTDPRVVTAVTATTFTVAGEVLVAYTSGGTAEVGYLATSNVARRPRYYMASRYDDFKYWTSYRTEVVGTTTNEYGIAQNLDTGTVTPSYYIYDAAPFVVYKESVPANRVTVKMQTNVGDINNGPYRIGNNPNVPDPLYGIQNQTTPKRWSVQKLNESNQWTEIISFTEASTRSDGSPIIGSDGHVEIEYGLSIPSLYAGVFTFAGEISSTSMLPDLAPYGYAYLYKTSSTDRGTLYISDGGNWQAFAPEYKWSVMEGSITKNTSVVTQLTNPDYFLDGANKVYREFEFFNGLRIVVDTMNKVNSTFDLIELSPRLVADITNKVAQYSITKTLADLGNNSMPTGNLIASVGQLTVFDDDLAFNENNVFDPNDNTGSIISQYSNGKMKFLFYDIIKNIGGYDYYLPLKTLYSEKTPQVSDTAATLNFELRDLFFLLESKKAPEMLLTGVSLSYAIMVLLDSVGFSNYIFKRLAGEDELIIPYFFVGPEQSVAEVLQQLAVSSQSAMFFDEYNDLIVMSKNYILPSSETDRKTDLVLYGQETSDGDGIALPNIQNISSQEKRVYNGGELVYTTRYIQKSIGSIAQAPYIDEYKTYIYKPVLLWEVAGQEATKTINESATQASGYSLAAIPLKTDLSADVPTYSGGSITNNILDFGEGVYWLGNYSGYFYANGEIIRYDAVEYAVAGVGTVWIKNNQEYQSYFARLRFNGKMYPTGRVRIYTNIKDGAIKEHGRGQFGTDIVDHRAGIGTTSTWVNDDYIRGSIQNARDYLFNTNKKINYPINTGIAAAGQTKYISGQPYSAQSYAIKATRNGIIKNFMANTNITENDVNYYKTALAGSVQTSALVFNGPTLPTEIDPADFVSYVYKPLDKPFKHFGTRLRIIGRVESGTNKDQSAIGAFDIYSPDAAASGDPAKQVSITGGSGGIAFGLNKDTNIGYYFEIAALSQNQVSSYKNNSNSVGYTILTSPVTQATSDTVVVTLKEQHNFEVGTSVVITGLTDDADRTRPSRLNGEFTVTEISQDRKQFKYVIPSPAVTTATVTAATGDGNKIVYTANNHSFSVGERVTITGLPNASFNLSNVIITAVESPLVGSDTFTVASTVSGSTSGSGTATYLPLTTISSSGGTASVQTDSDTMISDVFFYKVVSGSNYADIIKKQRTDDIATLTTLRDHEISVGESITVTGVDGTFNGTYVVTAVGSRTISYVTPTSGNIAIADVDPIGLAESVEKYAIPEILWRGITEIVVDDGKFTTQSRLTNSEKTTVYDLSAEFLDIGTTRQFYLYLNDKQIAVVNDTNPLPQYNNLALFVRGGSRVMFENVYALSDGFASNTARALQLPISKIFGDDVITESEAIRKYAISGIIQNTYLSGISSESPPVYSIYYDEFGTIMREVAYFNIKYDRAYPSLYSQLAKTLNRVRGYTSSGFFGGSYGAEFLIFNAIDKNLNLDDTSGNYLRILGIAFTQNTTHNLKVDDFFKKNSNFTDASYSGVNAGEYQELYMDLLNSRNKYGTSDFSINAPYIQTDAAAEETMDWIIRKVMYPRKTIGVNTFATPHLQLGDIVTINYQSNGVDIISPTTTRYVVYNIEYQKQSTAMQTVIHLAEV